MNKIGTIVNKGEAEVLATEIQDLMKKYILLQEDLEDTTGIDHIAVTGIEVPFDVSKNCQVYN